MMRRREFITYLGASATAWPLAARAQQGGRVRRIGVLTGFAEDDDIRDRVAAFRQGLERLGWFEGRNARIDIRHAASAGSARELVALQPDVILAQGTPAAALLQRESRTIPIVFVSVSDPIGSGLVTSLARPGGNLTGFLLYEASITGKWLAMLKEIAPPLKHALLLGNPKAMPYDYFLTAAEAAASPLSIELMPGRVETVNEIERTIQTFARQLDAGVVVLPGFARNDVVIELVARYSLPAVYSDRAFVNAGGLISYDIERLDQMRQAAAYVSRIHKGDKPSDLPVQAPVKYETVLNLKTAKALGLNVPDLMLVRADEVIE